MTVLIIDTTTERGLVALGSVDGTITAEKRLPPGFQNSDHLFPALQELGVEPQSIELIICAVGPGSYTGIRVGAVAAKTFSFANNIPLVGVCTLHGFESPALIDAKMGGAYLLKDDSWVRLPLEKALEEIDSEEIFTPNAAQLIAKAPLIKWKEIYPSAEKYLKVGLSNRGQASTMGELEIHY